MIWPLRISRERAALYGGALIVAPLYQMVVNTLNTLRYSDWSIFWNAGSMVGSPALMDPRQHCAHLIAHMGCQAFPYPPAVAILVWPFSKLPLLPSFIVEAALMLAFAIIAAILLADAFDIPRWLAILATVAWAPLRNSIIWGQNETLAVFLIALAIVAAKTNRSVLLGLAIGGLLYKPSIGIPFVLLLALRRDWRALAIVAIASVGWYVAGVIAAAGHWDWPMQYAHNLSGYFAADFAKNASKSVSLPDILMQLGATPMIAAISGLALFALAIPKLLRVRLMSALAIMSIVCVATSLHAWNYAATIVIPALFYVMRTVAEPLRTWIVGLSYPIVFASLFLLPGFRTWDVQVVVVFGLTALLIFYPEVDLKVRTIDAARADATHGLPPLTSI